MQAQRDAAQKEADSARRLEGDPVEQERQSMMSICRSLNVEMVEMNPDGHWSVILHTHTQSRVEARTWLACWPLTAFFFCIFLFHRTVFMPPSPIS